MGARSRRKGAGFEREVAQLARELGFAKARRAAPMQAGHGSDGAADVENVGRLWIEAKRRRKGSLYALAVDATKERPGWIPVLAYREDNGPALAVLPLAELLKLEAQRFPTMGGGGTWSALEIEDLLNNETAGKDPEAPA